MHFASTNPQGFVAYLVKITFRAKRPVNPAYPTELLTLGDHLRKTRLDRGLSQSDVARIFKVATDTVTGWEMNRHKPSLKLAKVIVGFLGYIPFETENLTFESSFSMPG